MNEEQDNSNLKFTEIIKNFIVKKREVTWKALLFGLLFGAILASANVYLAMKVGAFNPGSMPGAILGSGLLHLFGSSNLILETNIIQTIASAGANFSGVFFGALPVASHFDVMPPYFLMVLYLAFGGIVGISLTVLFRRYLVVEEGLPYPSGTAVGNTLEVVNEGKSSIKKMKLLLSGLVIASVVALLQSQIFNGFLPSAINFTDKLPNGFMYGIAFSPLLLGFGYIMGLKSAIGYFSGTVLSWLIISPVVVSQGIVEKAAWAPIAKLIASPASGLLIGGTLLPMVINFESVINAFKALANFRSKGDGQSEEQDDTELDLPLKVPLIIIGIGALLMIFSFGNYAPLWGFPFVIVLAIVFGLVAARATGETGICPTSLFVWIAMAAIGAFITKNPGVIAFLAGIAAVAVGQASDSMNDLKTGHMVKATPASQQLVQYAGLIGGAIAAPFAFKVIVEAHGIFNQQFPVPFGVVAKGIVTSISQGTNPFNGLTLSAGLLGGGVLSFFGLPALPVGLGMFAPVTFGPTVLIGGLIRKYLSSKGEEEEDDGVAFFSGALAGQGLMGVITAAIIAFFL